MVRRGPADLSDLSKQNFRAARRAIETVGIDAPDRLERQADLGLSLEVGNYNELAAFPPELGQELLSVIVGAVIGQFSAVQFVSRTGFRVFRIQNRDAFQVAVLVTSAPLALAGGAPAFNRGFQAPATSIVLTGGANAASQGSGFIISAAAGNAAQSYVVFDYRPIWVPPGFSLVLQTPGNNQSLTCDLFVSEVPAAA